MTIQRSEAIPHIENVIRRKAQMDSQHGQDMPTQPWKWKVEKLLCSEDEQ